MHVFPVAGIISFRRKFLDAEHLITYLCPPGWLAAWLSQICCYPIGLECMFGFGDYECLIVIGWFRWVKTYIQQTSPMMSHDVM